MSHKLTTFLSSVDVELTFHINVIVDGDGCHTKHPMFHCKANPGIDVVNGHVLEDLTGYGNTLSEALLDFVNRLNTANANGKHISINHADHLRLDRYPLPLNLDIDVDIDNPEIEA